ncbi:MAG: hypothetical protein AAF533_08200 [Acidobacteriota bacterium]
MRAHQSEVLVTKAARSARIQRARGSHRSTRSLYYEAHSLLRSLPRYLRDIDLAA